MTATAPRGKRHTDCLDHIRHDYARSGWICLTSAEPDRADAMRAFVDHLSEVAARHHAAELARPSADGSHRRLSADAERWITDNPDFMGEYGHVLAPGIRGRVASWIAPMGGTARASQCNGHTCAPRPSIYAEPVKPARVKRARLAQLAPAPVRAELQELAADLIEQGRALGILEPERSPFALPDPIVQADALAPADDGPAVVDLAYTAETEDGLEPVSITEPARPEPAPVRLSIVPPADGRPSCARCGQTFRASGVGLAWHVKNRPDCARALRTA